MVELQIETYYWTTEKVAYTIVYEQWFSIVIQPISPPKKVGSNIEW